MKYSEGKMLRIIISGMTRCYNTESMRCTKNKDSSGNRNIKKAKQCPARLNTVEKSLYNGPCRVLQARCPSCHTTNQQYQSTEWNTFWQHKQIKSWLDGHLWHQRGRGHLFIRSLLRAGVQPTLDPSAETVSRSNALAQGERRETGWCVRVCAWCAGKEG